MQSSTDKNMICFLSIETDNKNQSVNDNKLNTNTSDDRIQTTMTETYLASFGTCCLKLTSWNCVQKSSTDSLKYGLKSHLFDQAYFGRQ